MQDARREEVNTFLPMLELQRRLQVCAPPPAVVPRLLLRRGLPLVDDAQLAPRRVPVYRERFERYLREPAWQVITSAAYDERALDVVAGRVLGSRGRRATRRLPQR